MSASDISTQTDSRCSRRGFLRRGAASAGAVGAITAGGSQVAPEYAPVGRAEAATFIGGGTWRAGTLAAGSVLEWIDPRDPGEPEEDAEDYLNDWIYEAAASSASGRDAFVSELEHEFLSSDEPINTPFGRAASAEVRAAIASHPDDEAEALQAAIDALNRQATRAITNLVEKWNGALLSIAEPMVVDFKEGIGVFDNRNHTQSFSDTLRPVEATQYEDDEETRNILYEWKITPPAQLGEISDRDEELWVIGWWHDSNPARFSSPANELSSNWRTSSGFGEHEAITATTLDAEHPEYPDLEFLDAGLWAELFEVIEDAYGEIMDNLEDYVESVTSAIDHGTIDQEDILGPSDVLRDFDDTTDQEAYAKELMAMGAEIPDQAGYQAKVSHDDLSGDLWGMVFPQFTDPDDSPAIMPGVVIEPDEYNMAYFGYESASDGEWQTELLSGDEPLEILQVEGVDGQEEIDVGDDVAGENGLVVIHDGHNPPEQIAEPDEYEGWVVSVTGSPTQYTADIGEIEQDVDTGEYVLPETDLDENEPIERVEILPGVEYSRTVDYIADPQEVTEEDIKRIEHLSEQAEQLEEALGASAHGGGGGGGGTNTLLIGGGIIALVGMAMAALAGDS